MKNKSIILIISILFIGLGIAGGTYAFLSSSVNATNNSYNTVTGCFNIDYTIDNGDSTQDITGTLFPSSGPSGGLSGRVSLKANATCGISGIGTLKLHINSGTSSNLMTSASSYCENRSTMQPISGTSTKAECAKVGGRWRGYGDSYCEDDYTLERLTDYDSSNCSSNGGTWKSGGSPLKYAVYNNASATGIPIGMGYITSSDIGNDIVIADNIYINNTQLYYYIFVWIDGYLVGNEVNNLPFNGYVKAEASQDPYVYTVNDFDTRVAIGSAIPSNVTQYATAEAAMAAFGHPFFLRHRIQNGVVSESYVGVAITNDLATSYRQVGEVYTFRGGVDESSLSSYPIFDNNRFIAGRLLNIHRQNRQDSGLQNIFVRKDNIYLFIVVNGNIELNENTGNLTGCSTDGEGSCG